MRVLGSGHSFSEIAGTSGVLVSLDDLPPVFEVAGDRRSVRVGAATRLGDLAERLHRHGLALHTMPSLPHISIAGACLTATHGSGDRTGSLAGAVRSMEVIRADGSMEVVSEDLDGHVVSLGVLGVVTTLELDVLPSYDVEQVVHEDLPWRAFVDHLDEVFACAYSVSAFTDWVDPDVMVWRKQFAGAPIDADWLGAHVADGPRHPIKGMPADYATQQGGVPGPWNERLPHFRLEFTPSNGDELQSEYFVPRERAAEAFELLRALGNRLAPLIQVSEVRTIAADDLWLSPSQGRDTVALHFTWIQDEPAVLPALSAIEDALNPLGARPHWGKVFTADATYLRTAYPMVPTFTELAAKHDPTAKFRNPYLDTYLPRA